jgi:uncharacterized membrane protein
LTNPRTRVPPGIFSLLAVAVLFVLLPFILAETVLAALTKLGLSPGVSLGLALAILVGSVVNIPVRRTPHVEPGPAPAPMFGLERWAPRLVERTSGSVLAVNLGGCVIPVGIVAYQLVRLAAVGVVPLAVTLGAVVLNCAACYWVARPVPGVGILMRPIVPAALAALCAMSFEPELAPPIAFTAGVLGPLIGADLLHLRDLQRAAGGVSSIGGAGTFDGIVLSGVVATLLA